MPNMTISINDALIAQKGLELNEFFYMLLLYLKVDINNVDIKKLSEYNLVGQKVKFNEKTHFMEPIGGFLTDDGRNIVRDILLDSDKNIDKGDDLVELAVCMQNLFPKGKKEGTNYYWKGSTQETVRKLQIFFKRYGKVPYDDILNATKAYVESFKDSRQYMQLLKYFIWKDQKDGSQESMLLSYIENYGQEDQNRPPEDWTTNLK